MGGVKFLVAPLPRPPPFASPSPTQLRLVTPQLCERVIFGGVRAIGIVVECGRSAKLKRQDHIRPKQGPENIGKGNRRGGRHKKAACVAVSR